MPGTTTPPSLAEQLEAMSKRLEDLERPSTPTPRETGIEELRFSGGGALEVTTSTPDETKMSGQLIGVLVLLGTAGTTSTVVTVYINGTSIGTVTISAAATRAAAYLGNHRIVADTDRVTVGVTTAGAGAKDITVKLRIRA